MQTKPRVFISYQRNSSRDLARLLNDALVKANIDVFFDVDVIPPGADFSAVIEAEIISRDVLIAILTPTTLQSEWVRREIITAKKHNKTIIPFRVPEFTFAPAQLHAEVDFIANYNAITYHYEHPQVALDKLIQAIDPAAKSTAKPRVLKTTWMQQTFILVALVILIALIFVFITNRPSNDSSDPTAVANTSTTNCTTGDNGMILACGSITNSEITIQTIEGASTEEIAVYLRDEITQSNQALDNRLMIIDTSIAPEHLADPLEDARETLAPSIAESINESYQQLITTAEVNSLRSTIGNYDLPSSVSDLTMDAAQRLDLDTTNFQQYYVLLSDVEAATDALITSYAELAEDVTSSFDQDRLAIDMRKVMIESQIAYNYSLLILNQIATQYNTNVSLNGYTMLEPNELPTTDVIRENLDTYIQQLTELALVRAQSIYEQSVATAIDIDSYEDLNDLLIIEATDTWDMVLGKAITLRQFGRTDEAIDAFEQYGEMFSEGDPTAQQYAETATLFSQQLSSLDVGDGGIYIFAIQPDSTAEVAGLQAGDIIIRFNGNHVQNMCDLIASGVSPTTPDALEICEISTINSYAAGDILAIHYLRLQPDGSFTLQQTAITVDENGRLGIGFMPI